MPDKKVLTGLIKLMFLSGVIVISAILLRSIATPDQGKTVQSEQLKVRLDDLQIGEYKIVEWHKLPVVILRRDPKLVAELSTINAQLYDPLSKIDTDASYIKAEQRSINAEYFIAMNLGTYCGCLLRYDKTWRGKQLPGGAFYDPCHTGTYDIAGRVLSASMQTPTFACRRTRMSNLKIPAHRFVEKDVVIIGEAP